MRYRTLGATGMEVSVKCLGTTMLGHEGNGDHEARTQIAHRALDAGIKFINTADAYSGGGPSPCGGVTRRVVLCE